MKKNLTCDKLFEQYHVEDSFEKSAHEIVCKMIDMGMIESEPEGLAFEFEIVEILKKNMCK